MAGELGGPTAAACRGLIAEVVRTPVLVELVDQVVLPLLWGLASPAGGSG